MMRSFTLKVTFNGEGNEGIVPFDRLGANGLLRTRFGNVFRRVGDPADRTRLVRRLPYVSRNHGTLNPPVGRDFVTVGP